MASTRNRTGTGRSRLSWAQLKDAVIGRVPRRNAGFFSGDAEDASGSTEGVESAEAVESGSDAGSSSGSEQSGAVRSSDGDQASDEQDTSTGSDGATRDGGSEQQEGLRVREERLSVDHQIGVGAVDGAWWPPSDVATEAVAQLIADLPDDLGTVSRVALPMADWSDEQPRSVEVEGRPVHVAWFSGMRRHTARVTFTDDEPLLLLVLPPSTEADAAGEVLDAVGADRSRVDLLAKVGIQVEPADGEPADSGQTDSEHADSEHADSEHADGEQAEGKQAEG